MADWALKLDAFLEFNGRDILTHAGAIQAQVARILVETRYETFDSLRRAEIARAADAADFDTIERFGRGAS